MPNGEITLKDWLALTCFSCITSPALTPPFHCCRVKLALVFRALGEIITGVFLNIGACLSSSHLLSCFYLNLPPQQINLNCTFSEPLSLRAYLAGILKWLSWIFCTWLAPSTVSYWFVFPFWHSLLAILFSFQRVLLTLCVNLAFTSRRLKRRNANVPCIGPWPRSEICVA